MKNVSLIAILAMILAPALGFAQPNKEIVPFGSPGYKYQFVKSADKKTKTFFDPMKSDATIGGWATTPPGQGAWGTLNKPNSDPCPLNISANVKILWPSGRDVLIRKWFTASELEGASNVRITVAIDNAVVVYWNGKPVFLNGQPAGKFTHDVCAAETFPGSKTPNGDVTFTVPVTSLTPVTLPDGSKKHLLAVQGVTLSEKSYIDIKVVGDFGYKLTTFVNGPGTIEVSPIKDFYSPTDQITIKATVTETGYFFGRGTNPATLQTGWDGVPFAAGAFQFANPVTFSISQNTTVTAHFNLFPAPQEFLVTSNGDLGAGTLRQALEMADNYPGPDKIVFGSITSIKLDAPLQTSDVVIINQSGGLVTVEPRDRSSFGSDDAFELPGVFVNWGYTSGGIKIRGLKVQNFPGSGICINSNGNTIQGCIITNNGTVTDDIAVGDGICIEDGSDNTIQGNEIYGNKGRGVSIREASVSDAVPPPSGNTIQGNSVYSNGGLGIDLADRLGFFGVTMNRYIPLFDPETGNTYDWDDFINKAQHYPDLESADPLTSKVKCRLYAPAGKSFSIEIFRDWNPEQGGEKQKLLGSNLNSSAYLPEGASGGVYTFELITTQPFDLGDVISATATDENGNTSEFSPSIYAGVKTRVYGPVENPTSPSNRWVANTTFRGLPLHWADGKAVFAVEDGFASDPDFPLVPTGTDPVAIAFDAWNNSGTPLVVSKAANPGPSEGWGGIPDGVNNIVWTDDFQTLTYGDFEGALALSRVRYNSFTAEIFDADVLVNGELVNRYKTYDLAGVLAHEMGHAAGGLSDIYDRNDQPYNLFMGTRPASGEVTMYGIVKEGDTYQTTIHQDDLAGLTYIFGNVLPSYVDLVLVIDVSQTYASASGYNAFTPSIDAALEIVDKLRVGDGVAVVTFPGSDLNTSTTYPAFQRIGSTDPQGDKNNIKNAIATIQPAVGDDRRSIGAALTAAAAALPATNPGRRGAFLISAGNETETPSALDPAVLQVLVGTNPVHVFTMGFAQSPEGANLGSKLAEATGGLFYETGINTISPITNHAWEVLIGQQLLLDNQSFSGEDQAISYKGSPTWQAISWKGATSQAISWQGATNTALIDDGTTGLYPAISWKGSASVAKISTEKTSAGGPKFFLALITPDFVGDPSEYGWADVETEPFGTISPGHLPAGVEYVEGDTYSFYRITAEYTGKRDGKWILVPLGANGLNAVEPTVPVVLNGRVTTVTDVVMEVEFDKSNYLPGEPVKITVSLFEGGQVQASHTLGGGPITGEGGGITAVVTLPDGTTTEPLGFDEVGNGVYTRTFTATQTKGTYDFVVTATGSAPKSGDDYFRKYDQAVYVAPPYASASLFAQNNVTMLDGSKVITGDILVNQPVPSQGTGVSLLVGLGASTPGGYVIKADKIQVLAGATVASTIYTTAAPLNAGTITGTVNTGFSPPYGAFPAFEAATGDLASDINVNTGGTRTITPNTTGGPSFGAVTLQPGSFLILEPGVYEFKSLRMKSGASLWCKGPTTIRIRSGIHADNGSYLGTKPDLFVSPSDILVYVAGTNAEGPGSYSVDISPKSKVLASLDAPNGTIYLNQETQAAGAFFAKDIVLGQLTTVRLSSGFTIIAKSASDAENAGLADDVSVPKTYELSQNYPNPFNPTTQIKYGLPAAGPVNLTVYNMLGQEVARLVDQVQPEGYHVAEWNGRNQLGTMVGSGMYIFQLRAGDFVQTRKMMLLK